ncbi:MAG: ribose 5-phosphate isomerase B [Oscillospiraceae bacterium]|jgi:ribose 5-phosphate isomerase B|nr:ribose 5-phosphate isomerase B [Oscillospiraceae bacterium]
MIKIAIGSDHGGFHLKEAIKSFLNENKFDLEDFGTYNKESSDYTEFAFKVGKSVSIGKCQLGIICCKTGAGVCIVSNKIKGIRSVSCFNKKSAQMARRHNDANVLCLGSIFVEPKEGVEIVKIFLETSFEFGRHLLRVQNISKIENNIFK